MKATAILVSLLITILATANVASESIAEACVTELNQARIHLDKFLFSYGTEESRRLAVEYTAAKNKFVTYHAASTQKTNDEENTVYPCPSPPPTLFPPASTVSTTPGSTPSGPAERNYKMTAPVPSFMNLPPEYDPFFKWISILKKYLDNEKDVCHGPKFTDLNSITEEQLWGFISLLAVNAGDPLCFICNEIVGIIKQLLGQLGITFSMKEKLFLDTMLALSPNNNGICQLLIPSCFADNTTIQANTSNTHNATECLKCSVCKSSFIALQNYVFLDQSNMDIVDNATELIVNYICTEYCLHVNLTQPWNQQTCVKTGMTILETVLKAAQKLLMPDPFCQMAFGTDWCPANSTPNMVKCLRDYCIAGFPSLARPLCEFLFPAPNDKFNVQDPVVNNDIFMNTNSHVEL